MRRPMLNMGDTIPWASILDWIKGRMCRPTGVLGRGLSEEKRWLHKPENLRYILDPKVRGRNHTIGHGHSHSQTLHACEYTYINNKSKKIKGWSELSMSTPLSSPLLPHSLFKEAMWPPASHSSHQAFSAMMWTQITLPPLSRFLFGIVPQQ